MVLGRNKEDTSNSQGRARFWRDSSITESQPGQGHLASQYHTTSGDSALVARPNRLGHSNKTKGKGGKAPGRIMIAAGKLK